MLKRPRHKQGQEDIAETAFRVYQEAIGEAPPLPPDERDPEHVELGRRGGKVGGKRRAAKLTPEERSAIAKRAAEARWKRD